MMKQDDEEEEQDNHESNLDYDIEDDYQGMDQYEDGDNLSDEEEDDVQALRKNLDPNLLAAAHEMGIDANSEQIHELQKFI